MSRPPNREFQEWWNKQRASDRDLLADKSDGFTRSFLTVDIPTVPSDRESVEKEPARSARQLSWVCLLRFQQIASSLAWLSNGFLSLLRTANRRIPSPDSLFDSKSSRLYRVIKVFLAVVLLLLVFELVAYFKGWYFSPPTARADVYGMIGLIYAKWLEIRADYLATPLQSLTNMCIVLFLVQSIVRVIWILRCCWIKLRGLKPVASMEYPTNAKNDDVNVEDYPMVLVQVPMCNEREANETNEDSNAKKRSKPNESEGTENGSVKVEEESKGGATSNDGGDEKQTKGNSSKPPEPPKDYIHVRARRGQATDSHSLAERGRREKISERMKLLQDLVPGCNKVTGKAHMLDEVINYVQSLQRQVEFLSVKLASVNTRLDFNIDHLISKDMLQSSNSLSHRLFPLDSSAQAFYGLYTQQNPGIHNNILNGVMSHSTVDPLETATLSQNMGMQLPPLNGFNEGGYQFPVEFCEDDLHTFVQMGFGQSGAGKSHSQNFNGSNQVTHLKFEP